MRCKQCAILEDKWLKVRELRLEDGKCYHLDMSELHDEIKELQAQLARCVVELKNAGCWLDSLNDLPKTTHLDAEVLKCAEAWVKAKDAPTKQKDFSDYLYDIEVAVRAKMEASND